MKKYLFILGLVGTALFTACSSADDLVKTEIPSPGLSEEENALIVEAGKDSDVPITMSAGRNRGYTRAPIDPVPETDGLFVTPYDADHKDPADGKSQYLGVYCLARGKQVDAPNISSIPSDDSGINWRDTKYAKWLDNTPAKVVMKAAESPLPAYSDVVFMRDDFTDVQPRFYPFGNWYYYDFYAYYPRITTMAGAEDIIIADYTITGKEDIIHAHATTDDAYDPDNNVETNNSVKSFSSKFFRLINSDTGIDELSKFNCLPIFVFEHKLAQLFFKIRAASTEDAEKLIARGITLRNLKIKNCYTGVRLFVASKRAAPLNTGAIALKTDTSGEIEAWTGTEGSESHPADVVIATSTTDTDPHDVGYLMVPPSALIDKDGIPTDHRKYVVSLGMNPEGVPDTELTLDMSFEAGKKYIITIDVYAPEKIQARAKLTGWTEQTIDPIPVY